MTQEQLNWPVGLFSCSKQDKERALERKYSGIFHF